MGERPNVVIPSHGPVDRDFVREFRPWWQQAEEKWCGKFIPYHLRHIHDSEWRERFWSIQKAHDRRGAWRYIAWLFYFSMYAFAVGTAALTILEVGVPMIVLCIGVVIFMKLFMKAAEDV